MEAITQIVQSFQKEYAKTPTKLKLIDCFILYVSATSAIQFLYVLLVGTFPFNAFLAGFLCSVGMLVFTICLRMQTNPNNRDEFHFSLERAYADYTFACLTLFLIVWNFIG